MFDSTLVCGTLREAAAEGGVRRVALEGRGGVGPALKDGGFSRGGLEDFLRGSGGGGMRTLGAGGGSGAV